MNQQTQQALWQCLTELIDVGLTTDRQSELRELLAGEAEAREYYLQFMQLHARLELMHASVDAEAVAEIDRPQPTATRLLRRGGRAVYELARTDMALSLVVASLVTTTIVLSLALWVVPALTPAVPGNAGPSIEFVARITGSAGATFDPASDGNAKNRDLFADDTIVLNSGLATVTYDSGAQVVLQGPATYQIQGANGGDLRLGKLVARVDTKAAHGFTVEIPGARIVDLGTEFGVEVAENGGSQVAVVSGEVELIGQAGGAGSRQRVRLTAGERASVAAESGAIARHDGGTAQGLAHMTDWLREMGPNVLLRVDFQNSQGLAIPAVTKPGFVAFTERHATGDGTASAIYSTRAGHVRVEISGLDSNRKGFFNRAPGIVGSERLTAAPLYNDFAFHNGGSGASLKLKLSGAGVTANTDYSLTFYSYDSGGGVGNRHSVVFQGSDGAAGDAPPIVYTIGADPETNDQYATTGTFTSDKSGVLTVRLTDTIVGSEPDGIRLNGFELSLTGETGAEERNVKPKP